jgi:anti-sigma B factor antagonist
MPRPFSMQVKAGATKLDVAISGELDVLSAPKLCATIELAITEGATDVVLDCRAVTFVDSSGIGALLDVQKQLAAAGGVLILFGPTEGLARNLALTGLNEVFHIIDTAPDG